MTVSLAKDALVAGGGFLLDQAESLVHAALPGLPEFPPVEHVPTGRWVRLRGRGRAYVIDEPGPRPDAPVVVLLHGLASPAAVCWAATIGPLSRVARVIAFDQRWHGRGITSAHFTLEDCADDVAAVLDTLGVERAIMAGYSLGGAIAQMTWSRQRSRVAGLVLCSTSRNAQGGISERLFFPFMNLATRSMREYAAVRVSTKSANLPDPHPFDKDDVTAWGRAEMATMSPWAIPLAMNAFGHFNSAPWIGEVDVPTAVVVTDQDRVIPTRRQLKLAESIPRAFVHRAPGGHTSIAFDVDNWLPVFLDAVGEVSAAARAGRQRHSG